MIELYKILTHHLYELGYKVMFSGGVGFTVFFEEAEPPSNSIRIAVKNNVLGYYKKSPDLSIRVQFVSGPATTTYNIEWIEIENIHNPELVERLLNVIEHEANEAKKLYPRTTRSVD